MLIQSRSSSPTTRLAPNTAKVLAVTPHSDRKINSITETRLGSGSWSIHVGNNSRTHTHHERPPALVLLVTTRHFFETRGDGQASKAHIFWAFNPQGRAGFGTRSRTGVLGECIISSVRGAFVFPRDIKYRSRAVKASRLESLRIHVLTMGCAVSGNNFCQFLANTWYNVGTQNPEMTPP